MGVAVQVEDITVLSVTTATATATATTTATVPNCAPVNSSGVIVDYLAQFSAVDVAVGISVANSTVTDAVLRAVTVRSQAFSNRLLQTVTSVVPTVCDCSMNLAVGLRGCCSWFALGLR